MSNQNPKNRRRAGILLSLLIEKLVGDKRITLASRLLCEREDRGTSCLISLEDRPVSLASLDRTKPANIKVRLSGAQAQILYARLTRHPEAFDPAQSFSRMRLLNLSVTAMPLVRSSVFCNQEASEGTCILTFEEHNPNPPSLGPEDD